MKKFSVRYRLEVNGRQQVEFRAHPAQLQAALVSAAEKIGHSEAEGIQAILRKLAELPQPCVMRAKNGNGWATFKIIPEAEEVKEVTIHEEDGWGVIVGQSVAGRDSWVFAFADETTLPVKVVERRYKSRHSLPGWGNERVV